MSYCYLWYNIIQVYSPDSYWYFIHVRLLFFPFCLAKHYAIYSDLFAEIFADFIFVGHASANYSTYGGNSHDSHGSLHREIAWIAFCYGSAKLPLHLSILQIVPCQTISVYLSTYLWLPTHTSRNIYSARINRDEWTLSTLFSNILAIWFHISET